MSKQPAKVAAGHLATLNTFAIVVSVMEGGCIQDPAGDKSAHRIIKICKQEMQRQVKKYDAALAAAEKQKGGA